ncbi:MAG: MBL fold metallo-hydrolase [Acetatifactor sp.]|nr:MBL fold metallo-hydrolase [Acetatifactor sp.]
MKKYFNIEKIRENITSIADPTGVRAFLIEGRDRAALVDTCCGIGNIKEPVQTLTNLPLTVICTHGHVDHAGGAYGFEDIYLNEKDFEVVKTHTTIEKRMGFGLACGFDCTVEDMIPQKTDAYKPLRDGQIFDLGGLTLECVEMTGHTPGMTSILIKELKTLILSDACNPFTYMFLPESASLETLKASLNRLLSGKYDFDTVWISHGDYLVPKTVINDVIECCDEIYADTDDKIPFESMGRLAYIAHRQGDNGRLDGKCGNVVYPRDIKRNVR